MSSSSRWLLVSPVGRQRRIASPRLASHCTALRLSSSTRQVTSANTLIVGSGCSRSRHRRPCCKQFQVQTVCALANRHAKRRICARARFSLLFVLQFFARFFLVCAVAFFSSCCRDGAHYLRTFTFVCAQNLLVLCSVVFCCLQFAYSFAHCCCSCCCCCCCRCCCR